MSDWQRKLDIETHWNDDGKEGHVQRLAAVIADKLRALPPFPSDNVEDNASWANFKKEDLIEEFESLASDENSTVEDFDYLMDDLYDWGDTAVDHTERSFSMRKKVCWIKTF